MPSTNKLYSRKSRKASRKTSGYIAKFLYTFCGIFASFGVVTILALAGTTTNASAVGNSSSSNTVSATLPGSVAIRLLNAEGTTEISSLDFNLTPTASGTSATQSMVVDVATSNPTGYKLYMQSNYQDSSSNYTTNLVHTTNGTPDADISDVIPTSTSASTLYWNYINPLLNDSNNGGSNSNPTPSVIPAHGSPDKLDQYFTTTNSRQTEVSFNVSVDTTIVSGTYENELLFSAVGNPSPVAYTVSFDADGGTPEPATISSSATSSTFSTIIDPATPIKTGYTFSYWNIGISSSGAGTVATATCNGSNTCSPGDTLSISALGEENITVQLTAVYNINSHKITVINDTGIAHTTISCDTGTTANTSSNTCDYGDIVTISSMPTTGYSFNGWMVDYGGITIDNNNQFVMPDNDITITASATKMYTHTLNLNKNDGTTDKQVLNYPVSGGTTDTAHTFTDLDNQAPSRAGYTFLGWATSSTGTNYVTSYTLDSSSAGTTPTSDGFPVTGDLYAIWQSKSLAEIANMQDMTPDICKNSAIGDNKTLTDIRDGKTYTIKKLDDNNCWMTQNLQFAPSSGTTLSSSTTDVDSDITPTISASCSSSTASSFCIGKPSLGTNIYYNWYAATAGTGVSSGNARNSICPKGWRLPTGGSGGEFEILYSYYNSASSMTNSTGPKFTRVGYLSNTSTSSTSYGYYWSNKNTYAMRLSSSAVSPAYSGSKNYGYSVRCIAKGIKGSLTINPNGGTWDGSSSTQTISADAGYAININNPIPSKHFSISYDANGQGATYTSYPTSIQAEFSGWALSGGGTFTQNENPEDGIVDGIYTPKPSASGILTAQYNDSSSSYFTLPTITKSGYSCSWAEGSASGAQHPGGATRSITSDTTYYAVCTTNNISSITSMQDMTPNICANTAVGTSKNLTDSRDNKTYTVKKLNDGRCWMTSNLLFAPSSSTTLQSTTSDVLSNIKWSSLSPTTTCSTDTAACVYSSAGYYNWFAATAGTGTSDMTSKMTLNSICPKGWKLPSSYTSGEFRKLYSAYYVNNDDDLGKSTYQALISSSGPYLLGKGYRSGTTNWTQDSWDYNCSDDSGSRTGTAYEYKDGYFWSNMASSASAKALAMVLYYQVYPYDYDDNGNCKKKSWYSYRTSPSSSESKQLGLKIRCIAR